MKQVDTLIKDLKLDEFDKYKRPFGIKNSYAIVIFFGLLYAINIIGFWRPFVLIAFGFIYPAQKTAQVYANSKEKSNQWMAYWMITAFLLIFDEYLLVIPFYRSAQPLLLLYLWNPRYNAAENLMNKLIGLSTFSSDPLKKLELSTADKFSLVKDIGKLFKKLE